LAQQWRVAGLFCVEAGIKLIFNDIEALSIPGCH
jgi:hypothetical protein